MNKFMSVLGFTGNCLLVIIAADTLIVLLAILSIVYGGMEVQHVPFFDYQIMVVVGVLSYAF